jgi:lipopolysaccharide export system permease protein
MARSAYLHGRSMFSIIDRYILVEVTKVFLIILLTLMLIVLSLLLLRTLEAVNVGALGTDLLWRFLGLQLVRDASSLLPPAFFVAVLVALGRMARDSEIIALYAGGAGPGRIYRGLLLFALPVALLTGWLSLSVRPGVVEEIQRIEAQQKEDVYQLAGVRQGRFYQHQQGALTLFVEEIENNKYLRNIFIQDRRGGQTRLVVSDGGTLTYDAESGDQFVTLLDGRRYDGVPGQADYAVGEFEKYRLRIEPRDMQDYRTLKRATFKTSDLIGSADLQDRAELEYRIAAPLAILTLTFTAVPLTSTSPRQRAPGRMFLAFLTYFSFFNLQRLAGHWLETDMTPTWLTSLWYQPLVLFLVFAVLLPETRWLKRILRRISALVGRS